MTHEDDDLHDALATALTYFPHFRAVLPPDYPRHVKYRITHEALTAYNARRRSRFWHTLNLPFALLNSFPNNQELVIRAQRAILRTLDDFARVFSDRPSANGLLAPLWRNCFNVCDPGFWAVWACAYLALRYQATGHEVVAFESRIGGGNTDADIRLRVGGTPVLVEVELWHSSSFARPTDDVRRDLQRRADEKAGRKFGTLPSDEYAMVAVIGLPDDAGVRAIVADPRLADRIVLDDRHRSWGWVGWIALVPDSEHRIVQILDSSVAVSS